MRYEEERDRRLNDFDQALLLIPCLKTGEFLKHSESQFLRSIVNKMQWISEAETSNRI